MNDQDNQSGVEDYSRYLWITVGLLAALILILGIYWISDSTRLARAAESLNEGRIERGEEVYQEQCAACHGSDGEGGLGPALNDKKLLKNTLDEVFYSVIRSGVPNTPMPAWSVEFGGPLTDEEVRDVVAHIRAWEADAPELVEEGHAADAGNGAVMFATTCEVCHGENGLGGNEGIPAINNPEKLNNLDDVWYRDVVANGRPAKGMPTWGTVLSPDQLDDIVALIGAWREGEYVAPSFSDTELIDRALYAVQQNDSESALLHIERVLVVVDGSGAETIAVIQVQLQSGDLAGAEAALVTLREEWPIGDPTSGAIIYSANCAVCHGPQGLGGIGPALQDNEFVQAHTNAELFQFLLEGRPGTSMAGFDGRLGDSELADMVAFLRLWQK